LDSRDVFFDCGEGYQAELRSDNLRRDGEHLLYVKGIDNYTNVGDTILTKWIVGMSFEIKSTFTGLIETKLYFTELIELSNIWQNFQTT
jgi:hypothetical protein